MKQPQSIVNKHSYSTVTIHLKELMEEKGLTRYRLAKLADTRFEVVEKWYNGSLDRIDTDILARFCYVLDCQIDDILHYHHENS